MLLSELLNNLDLCREDGEVVVEIDGIQHPIHEIQDTSQGPVLIVDSDQEEREMR